MSELAVPFAKPFVTPLLTSCESISSQPRVKPFFLTSLFLFTISIGCQKRVDRVLASGGLTQMRIIFVLIPSAPKHRSNCACTFDSSKREIPCFYHGPILCCSEAQVVWCEGILMFCIQLQTKAVSVDLTLPIRRNPHQTNTSQFNNSVWKWRRGKGPLELN